MTIVVKAFEKVKMFTRFLEHMPSTYHKAQGSIPSTAKYMYIFKNIYVHIFLNIYIYFKIYIYILKMQRTLLAKYLKWKKPKHDVMLH